MLLYYANIVWSEARYPMRVIYKVMSPKNREGVGAVTLLPFRLWRESMYLTQWNFDCISCQRMQIITN